MVSQSFGGLLSLRKLVLLTLQLCFCRRAMVNKIWCRKISRAWLETKTEPPSPRAFTEPRCQNYSATWYLVYRWGISFVWITVIICSMFEWGSYRPLGNNHKWPIYLTNWDLLLGWIQSLLGAYLVTRRWRLQARTDFDPGQMVLGKLEKAYWFSYTVTCTLAVGVTVSYWAAVYDPKIHVIDPLNVMLHVLNSVLMITDLCVASVPLRLKYFWWCIAVALAYLIFSIVYYSAGGLDKNGLHYIYKILDWKKPLLAFLVTFSAIVFLVIVHCLLCYLTGVLERWCVRNNACKSTTPSSPANELPPKSKELEIV